MIVNFIYPFIVSIILSASDVAEASLGSQSRHPEDEIKVDKLMSGPQKYTVFDKKFVSETPLAKDIIRNNQAFFTETDEHNFDGLALGFVTPWNNHGYDVAKIFGNKFTHISPVWLQITPQKSRTHNYVMKGMHDIDEKWMVTVRNAGRERKLKIFPRVLFEGWGTDNYNKLFANEKEMKNLTKSLVAVAKKYSFDGYVIELPHRFPPARLVTLMKNIATALGLEGKEIIPVIPPDRGQMELFSSEHFHALYDYVAAFSLMTYDFSNPYKPGPTAPLPWVKNCVKILTEDREKSKKILMGLNFYGYDYSLDSATPIIAHEYISRLKQINGKIEYDSKMAEHFFLHGDDAEDRHIVYYPTLYSIQKRLELAKKLNTGIVIWELGQGLDYFYDLL